MINNQLKIREAADFLDVSVDTLRRWEDKGKLKSLRGGAGEHRLYDLVALEEFLTTNCIDSAKKWARSNIGEKPNNLFY